MEYRRLGNTGLEVSALGFGVEHLKKKPVKEITSVIATAIDLGINYFDLVWSLPNVIEGISQAINNKDVHLAVHLGSSYRNGKYVKAKSVKRCEETFKETLDRLGKDSVSIINLHYVKNMMERRVCMFDNFIYAVYYLGYGARRLVEGQCFCFDIAKRSFMFRRLIISEALH